MRSRRPLWQARPNRHSVQVGASRHLVITNGAEFTQHSCEPNTRVEFCPDGTVWLVAVRPIRPLDLITFDYNTVEWDMAAPFDCLCGTPSCLGRIAGLRHAPVARSRKLALDGRLSPHLAWLLREGDN